MSISRPKTWYFPTPDPDVVIACDYNAAEDRYDNNCRTMKVGNVSDRVAVEMKRFSNAIIKYG
jgi:hypothetical protein